MKIHFDSNQEYQHEAIKAITDIFMQQSSVRGDYEVMNSENGTLLTENGVGNNLILTEEQILRQVQEIQERNEIMNPSTELHGMNFSVEMETGTGKTYVYLRTIYELHKQYGFKKFIIVVPSVAIREGVWKNLQITHDHFQNIYDKVSITSKVYDSKKVSDLRGFASNNAIQILVLNIDAFAKDDNIINKHNDRLSGKKPIEFIQSTNPIVIVDEPQNMETEIRKKAIDNLNPLCTLRYSATHTNRYNLMYSLNPVKAYDMGLVKQIEVDSVMSENDYNNTFIQLESVNRAGNIISAKLRLDVVTSSGKIVRKSVTANGKKLDLFELSGKNKKYDGLKIYEMDYGYKTVELTNGQMLNEGETLGGMNDEVMRYMIQRTVEEHLKKERDYKPKGIKVLSLFFIDKVKNYREYDEGGNPIQGKFARWFEEIFQEEILKPRNKNIIPDSISDVHNGYFSQDNKQRIKDSREGYESKEDNAVYKLIMQDKERLLDVNTSLRFIFSHSALREGWDNPNVFQICTLNETKSEVKKRQEIGRGLRLPVNQKGQRIFDRNINKLTVVANESYEDFARELQNEIEKDCGVNFSGKIKNKNDKLKVNYRKGFEADPKFLEIWEKIKFHSKYSVNYQTSELIINAAKAIYEMPQTIKPTISSTKKKVIITNEGITGELLTNSSFKQYTSSFAIPDMLAYIQAKTELTRSTILEILKKSKRISEILLNPQLFMDNAITAIKQQLYLLMVDGIKYEKIGDKFYEMSLFDDTDFETYLDGFTHTVRNAEKTIYENYIPLDSGVENQFAKDCESSEDVEFYFKLPTWFEIPTPIGKYRPDWALVLKGEKKIYFVAETKSAGQELRGSEKMKIKCGTEHFKKFDDVVFEKVTELKDCFELRII